MLFSPLYSTGTTAEEGHSDSGAKDTATEEGHSDSGAECTTAAEVHSDSRAYSYHPIVSGMQWLGGNDKLVNFALRNCYSAT